MEKTYGKVKKTRISTGLNTAVKRGRIHRFSKWVEHTYGIPWNSIYDKIRKGRIKEWEVCGIVRCMQEYGFHGSPGDLWNKCVRNRFVEFMEAKQMSRMTTWRKFSGNDFSELEMKGISATYRYWRENIDSSKV